MKKLQVEALVIDDSFINYCLQKNDTDTAYWRDFILAHPDEYETIREAQQLVLGLTSAMQQIGTPEAPAKRGLYRTLRGSFIKKYGRYAAAAAISGIIISVAVIRYGRLKDSGVIASDNRIAANGKNSFLTGNSQRKSIVLDDGTKIVLDAGSSLTVANDFGNKTRDVYLDGEAIFDVTHNEKLPFIVHTSFYSVRVLGTLFNVKAYHNEKSSETALLRGRVEIVLNDNKRIALRPNNKIVFSVGEGELIAGDKKADSMISVKPISFKAKDSTVIETAWAQDRLEINNETFEQIKSKLERWYDVKINFTDTDVAAYAFTATFEHESIEHVLRALQYSYHFNFRENGKNITISK